MPRNTKAREPQPTDVHIGARIRLSRKMSGMIQTEMAERTGVTFPQLQKYEKGVNRIGASRLMRICAVLNVTPAWLFASPAGEPDAGPTPRERELGDVIAAFHADAVAPRLMPLWVRLPPDIKHSMIKLMTIIVHGHEEPEPAASNEQP